MPSRCSPRPLTIGLTAFATAITQCRIGSAGVGALAENPGLFGNVLVSS